MRSMRHVDKMLPIQLLASGARLSMIVEAEFYLPDGKCHFPSQFALLAIDVQFGQLSTKQAVNCNGRACSATPKTLMNIFQTSATSPAQENCIIF